MAKKTNSEVERVEIAEPIVEAKPEQRKKLYRVSQWRGVREVFQCKQCGQFRDTKDEVLDHILLHYPANEREIVLEKLLEE